MTAPITSASNLNNKEIVKQYLKDFREANVLSPFMGSGNPFAAINVVADQSKGAGDSIYVSRLRALDADTDVKTGSQTLKGNEADLNINDDVITINYVRAAHKIEQHRLSNIRTPLDLYGMVRPNLTTLMAERMRNDIIDAAALTTGPIRPRVLYGSNEANYNATLATGLATVDSTDDRMTVDIVRLAKRQAFTGGINTGTRVAQRIRPLQIKTDKGMATGIQYVMLLDEVAAYDLKRDPEFRNHVYFNAEAAQIAGGAFAGGNYLGTIDGVMLYTVQDLSRIDHDTAGAGSIRVAHNLLLGASAFGVGMGGGVEFRDDSDDYDMMRGYAVTDIWGVKMLRFSNGSSTFEHGLVHVYTAGN